MLYTDNGQKRLIIEGGRGKEAASSEMHRAVHERIMMEGIPANG